MVSGQRTAQLNKDRNSGGQSTCDQVKNLRSTAPGLVKD